MGLALNETPSPLMCSCEALNGLLMVEGVNVPKLLSSTCLSLTCLRILFVSH